MSRVATVHLPARDREHADLALVEGLAAVDGEGADARLPGIARELTMSRADLLVDTATWVTAGLGPVTWNNPRTIRLFPTRARESGILAVAADNVGLGRDPVAYSGRSCIIAPDGQVAARASSERPETTIVDVALAAPALPAIRRPEELDGPLSRPTEELSVASAGPEALSPSEASRRYATPRSAERTDRRTYECSLMRVSTCSRRSKHRGQTPCKDDTRPATARS
jgi:hypothetical protein